MTTKSKDYMKGWKEGRIDLLKTLNDTPSTGDFIDKFNEIIEEEMPDEQ